MRVSRLAVFVSVLALSFTAASCGGNQSKETKLQGAGASFPAPLYLKWFKNYNAAHPNILVDYQSVGSGVKSFLDKTVDFAASDAAMATDPEVLLMDEPCSALDPIATRRIEELMMQLKTRYTIAIVTHNLQQAQRVADNTGFLYVDTTQGGRTGYLVEFGDSKRLFDQPQEKHTRDYLRGEFS